MEKRVRFQSRWLPWLLVAPQMAIVLVFFFWPAGQALYQSVLSQDAFGTSTEFVGMENFKRLFNDPLSQGQSNAYPLYRLEWQSVGSLERRLRSCMNGVKAELPPWGSPRMRELALYLRWRAQGLPVEMPAVRK